MKIASSHSSMIDNTKISILRGGYFHCTPYWNRTRIDYFFENGFGFYLPAKGGATIETVTGKCALRPDHVYFIPSTHLVAQTCEREMWVYWVFFVSDSFYLHHRLGSIRSVLEFPLASMAWVKEVFEQFVDFFEPPRPEECTDKRAEDSRKRENPSPSLTFLIEGTLMCLLSKVISATDRDFQWVDQEGMERLRPAIDYMEQHYLDNPAIEDVARRIQLTPNYFHRYFRQVTGMTPFKYMENRRLDLAHKLLFDQRLNITQVATEAGYRSLDYFSRAFRRRYGVPPSHLRRAP